MLSTCAAAASDFERLWLWWKTFYFIIFVSTHAAVKAVEELNQRLTVWTVQAVSWRRSPSAQVKVKSELLITGEDAWITISELVSLEPRELLSRWLEQPLIRWLYFTSCRFDHFLFLLNLVQTRQVAPRESGEVWATQAGQTNTTVPVWASRCVYRLWWRWGEAALPDWNKTRADAAKLVLPNFAPKGVISCSS